MSENKIQSILDTTMEKLKAMVNADVITGQPIVALQPAAAILQQSHSRVFSAAAAGQGLRLPPLRLWS